MHLPCLLECECILTRLVWTGEHWDHGDEDGADDVSDGEEQVDLDGARQLGLLPAEPRQAEDGHPDAQLPIRKVRHRMEEGRKVV